MSTFERREAELKREWDSCKLPLKVYNHMRERYGLEQARSEDLFKVGLPINASSTSRL